MRLGRGNSENFVFICLCARLSLYLQADIEDIVSDGIYMSVSYKILIPIRVICDLLFIFLV